MPLTWGGDGPADGCRARRALVSRRCCLAPPPRARVDVLHCTIFRAPPRARVPTILTVHDLAVLRHPEVFPVWTRLYGRTALRPTIRAADRVFAVSEFSKRETVELAGVDPDRVDVVPNALEPVFRADGEAAEGDYVLAVGTLEPRKNLARVVEATARAGVELRLVGAPGWGDARRRGHARDLARPDRRRRARGRLPRRARARLPVALRGLRHSRARGDGLRDAGRDERGQRDGRGDGGRRRARRSARRGLDRRRDRGGRPAARRARPARPRAGAPLHLGARGRRRRRRLRKALG